MAQYLLPMARNVVTGQTVKSQDLTGTRLTENQIAIAQDLADQMAARMTARSGSGDRWVGFVQRYSPSARSA